MLAPQQRNITMLFLAIGRKPGPRRDILQTLRAIAKKMTAILKTVLNMFVCYRLNLIIRYEERIKRGRKLI